MFIKLDVKRSLTLSISLYIYKNTDVTIKNKKEEAIISTVRAKISVFMVVANCNY